MQPTYCIFDATGVTSVAPAQPVVNGVSVQFVRNINRLNLNNNVQFYNFGGFSRQVLINLNNALTGIATVTIVGSNINGNVTETINTLSSGVTNSTNLYTNLTSVTVNLLPGQTFPNNTTISLGCGETGIAIVPIDTFVYMQQVNVAANVPVSGSVTYTISQTLDNTIYPNSATLNVIPQNSQFFEPIPSLAAQSASRIGNPAEIKIPISAIQIEVTESSGSAYFTVLQQGAAFR